jgi:hypothetical protein
VIFVRFVYCRVAVLVLLVVEVSVVCIGLVQQTMEEGRPSMLEDEDAPRPSWASPQQLQGLEDGDSVDRRKSRMECVLVEISIEGAKNITSKGSTYTVYVIHVSPGIKSWFVERRFSDFIYLNQQLQRYHPHLTFPPLPKKTVFASGSSARVVEERKQILQVYLSTIARIQSVWSRTELVRFLDNDSNSMMFVWNFERMQKMQQVCQY